MVQIQQSDPPHRRQHAFGHETLTLAKTVSLELSDAILRPLEQMPDLFEAQIRLGEIARMRVLAGHAVPEADSHGSARARWLPMMLGAYDSLPIRHHQN
ncbi:hypothetical protein [Methylobacterium nigriterrae]|uniref:hypothetical protein n=1 Tax=Methylobacterium nigriterrae TaxID=3127512 RepID=UPI003014169E